MTFPCPKPSFSPTCPAPQRPASAGVWPDHPDGFQLAYFTDLAGMWQERDDERLYFLFADTFPEPLLAARAWHGWLVRERRHPRAAPSRARTCREPGRPRCTVIAHTGDPFIPRAMDQLMAAASVGSRFILIGDDAGITNARNGVSHQSSAHPLLLNELDGIECFEPADWARLRRCHEPRAIAGDGHLLRPGP